MSSSIQKGTTKKPLSYDPIKSHSENAGALEITQFGSAVIKYLKFFLPALFKSHYSLVQREKIMITRDIYMSANLLIKQYGSRASQQAEARLKEYVEVQDVKAAGVWLAIGQAVQDLQQILDGKARH